MKNINLLKTEVISLITLTVISLSIVLLIITNVFI